MALPSEARLATSSASAARSCVRPMRTLQAQALSGDERQGATVRPLTAIPSVLLTWAMRFEEDALVELLEVRKGSNCRASPSPARAAAGGLADMRDGRDDGQHLHDADAYTDLDINSICRSPSRRTTACCAISSPRSASPSRRRSARVAPPDGERGRRRIQGGRDDRRGDARRTPRASRARDRPRLIPDLRARPWYGGGPVARLRRQPLADRLLEGSRIEERRWAQHAVVRRDGDLQME